MRHLQKASSPATQRNRRAGFTFVEVAVVAPIVILTIGIFITVIVNMTAEVLRSRSSSELAYKVQDAIDRIDEDVKLSVSFLAENNVEIVSPQGYDDDTENYENVGTGGDILIINALATTGNPLDVASSVAYLENQPNACGNQQGQNTPLTFNIVYFVKDNALWRRVIMPSGYDTDACNANGTDTAPPWQRPSCSPGYSDPFCQTEDEKLIDGISTDDFVITYYNSANATTANSAASDSAASVETRNTALRSAVTIGVSVNGSKTVAGQQISQSSSLRSTRLDINASTIADPVIVTAPSTPVVTGSFQAPKTGQFSWPTSSGNGTITYSLDYRIDNGSWQTGLTNSTNTSYEVDPGYNGAEIDVRVRATNSEGTSSYGEYTLTIPTWVPFILQNNWTNYDNTYSLPAYTMTKSRVVVVKGMIKRSGSPATNEVITNLPAGYRPEGRLIFGNTTSSNVAGRVDVLANGEIQIYSGSGSWFSLDTIRFVPNGPYTRTYATLLNGWTNYGSGYANLSTVTDDAGRIHQQGLIRPGTASDGTYFRNLTSAEATPFYSLFSGYACSGWSWYDAAPVSATAGMRIRNVNPASCLSPQMIWYPQSFSGWSSMSLTNGWTRYSTSWSAPQYTKASDGLVTLSGMISGGSTTYDSVITTLPVGYRPKERLLMTTTNNSGHARIDVLSNGQVRFMGSSNAWYSLDPVTFMAEG